MTTEPLRVEPVEVGYYEDRDVATARVVRTIATIGIIYGSFHAVMVVVQIAGMMMDTAWRQDPLRNAHALLEGCLALVLLGSAIGCMSYRRAARTGMFVYGYGALVLQAFAMGAYILIATRGMGGVQQLPAGYLFQVVLSYVGWMVQGSLFPLIVVMVFRIGEVRRLFERP